MLKAIKERVLVKLVQIKKKEGILIMPEEKKEYQIGHVISIGSDLDQKEFQAGGYVYTRKYAGLPLEYRGEEYISLDVKEILAVASELG